MKGILVAAAVLLSACNSRVYIISLDSYQQQGGGEFHVLRYTINGQYEHPEFRSICEVERFKAHLSTFAIIEGAND